MRGPEASQMGIESCLFFVELPNSRSSDPHESGDVLVIGHKGDAHIAMATSGSIVSK